jgi:hypothetical protein
MVVIFDSNATALLLKLYREAFNSRILDTFLLRRNEIQLNFIRFHFFVTTNGQP